MVRALFAVGVCIILVLVFGRSGAIQWLALVALAMWVTERFIAWVGK